MKIKVLGSVSPYCKGDLNCPGYLITNNDNKILLDCGNGILRNIDVYKDLINLTVIISHLHKDHYGDILSLGYTSFVLNNLGVLTEKIKVYIPKKNSNMTNQELIDYNFLINFKDDNYLEFIEYDDKTILNIEDINISFSKNVHPVCTYAVKIESGEKIIVYSSDTAYKNNTLESFCKDSDILICESSFIRGQVKKHDNHLYAYEAASIAKNAKVKKLVLTHFYPEVDKNKYLKEAKKIFENTFVSLENEYID